MAKASGKEKREGKGEREGKRVSAGFVCRSAKVLRGSLGEDGSGAGGAAGKAGGVDLRNGLNELGSVEWVQGTKSVWFSEPPARDILKAQHPATFAESDIDRLIKFFTKRGETVLDPFVGVGSTLVSCLNKGRSGVGVELSEKWVQIANKRLSIAKAQTSFDSWSGEDFSDSRPEVSVIQGDSRELMSRFSGESFDFIVTSPPYWNILQKANDHKSRAERISRGLATKYSASSDDLGNIEDYEAFLGELQKVWRECFRVLRCGRYMCVVVTDFRHKSRYFLYHSDIARIVEECGFVLKGVIILVQDSKELYPYGYPFSFVPNVHHQNILVFCKDRK